MSALGNPRRPGLEELPPGRGEAEPLESEELAHRGLALDLGRQLEDSRLKLASGAFSSCEIGCDLGRIEAMLTGADASSTPDSTAYWLDLLGRAMAEGVDPDSLLQNAAVRFQYLHCGFLPCKCDS